MKSADILLWIVGSAFFAGIAAGETANFAISDQNFGLTGLGPDSSGIPRVRPTWGTCSFDGTNTACTLSARVTSGPGEGGTISMVLTYPGNGVAPITAPVNAQGLFGPFTITAGSIATRMQLANGQTHYFNDGFAPVLFFDGTAVCSVTPCGTQQVGMTAGATITGKVNGQFDTTPVITHPPGIISASAFGAFPTAAPAGWVEIYGYQLATTPAAQQWAASDFAGINAPIRLGGTTVTIQGEPMFISYVSSGQINAQIPTTVLPGTHLVVVATAGGRSANFPLEIKAAQPGLLAPPAFNLNGQQYVAALFPDQAFALPPGASVSVPRRRARPGDTILLYGVGFGETNPVTAAGQIVQGTPQLQAPFTIRFAGVAARVDYAGLAPGYVGLYQFNVVVPNVAASDTVPLTFSVGTTNGTQTLVIPISN